MRRRGLSSTSTVSSAYFLGEQDADIEAGDPEASQSIFSNPILASKTTLITLDLTHQCLATRDVRKKLLHGAQPSKEPSKLRVILNEILEFFAKSYVEYFDIKAGPPLHDPLAAAVLFGYPSIYRDDGERYDVSVVTDGAHSILDSVRGQVGRTVVKKAETGVRIPRKLNLEEFWRVLEDCCARADIRNPDANAD